MHRSRITRRLMAGTAILLGTGLFTAFGAGPGLPAADAAVPAPVLAQTGGFADLVEGVMPAVVNVSSVQSRQPEGRQQPPATPFDEFFDRYRNPGPQGEPPMAPPGRRGMAQGSGFIIDADGYVVTNNHVIDGADEITVTLHDGTRLDAELVGTDPKTDIALLKVSSDKALPHVTFGDSDAARVGEAVVAIGNPFGLGGTVTAGIISAQGRSIGAGPYDDFLQIDAAINRGNSGGPTFNLDGEVIGINTAIFSPSGGSIGIGFAISANLAESVVAELREHGTVERGWIGVQIQPVTPDIAEGFGQPELKGALVADVVADGPAARAKLEPGDVITAVAGKPVTDLRDVTRRIADTDAGTSVDLEVMRDGRHQTVQVVPEAMPDEPQMAELGEPGSSDDAALGLVVAPLDPAARQRLGLPADLNGVVVMGADSRHAGKVAPGDVITAVGNEAVERPEQIAAKVKKAQDEGRNAVLLRVHREGTDRFVALEIDRA